MSRSLLVLVYFLPVTYAYTTFQTNCTLPSASDKINYLQQPNTRGTLGILWSCLFTIISCTWAVQCPDLPTHRDKFDDGKWGSFKWGAKKYLSLISWFLITMLAPEVLLGLYFAQAMRCKAYTKAFERSEYLNLDGVKWTKTHSHFAEMGGFVMKISKHSPNSGGPLTQTTGGGSYVTTQDPSEYVAHGQYSKKTHRQEANYLMLNCSRILALRKTGIAKRLPDISEYEIEDRSKEDGFLRAIAIVQIIWICVQTIVRWVGDLTVTQLEISTFAFAICAVLMYHRSWNKPKGVDIPITVFYYSGEAHEIEDQLERSEREVGQSVSGYEREWAMKFVFSRSPGATVEMKLSSAEELGGVAAITISGMIFGGIHLIAWNFVFPTQIEMALWRASALFCTCVMPAGFLTLLIREKISDWTGGRLIWPTTGFFVFLNLAGCVYVLARLFIIVEMFRTLAFQPIGAYVGTWTVNIPYLS